MEDVGIARIEVAAELVGIGTMAVGRKMFGGDLGALDYALARACASTKDRSGDHACSIVSREPVAPGDQVLQGASQNALLAVVASSSAPWSRRLRAAVIATGRGAAGCYPVRGATEMLFRVFLETGVPELLIATCATYAAVQRDALPVFVPLVWCLRTTDPTAGQPAVHCPAHDEQIGELPSYAFDPVNTRLGRRAVDLFMRAHLMKPPHSAKAVAAAIWNIESAACDKTAGWPLGEEMRQRAYRADLTFRGVPVEEHGALNAWIAAERPALIAARKAVWDSHVRQSQKPVQALEQAYLPLPVPGGWSRRG